jgi:hypothetical protein
MHNEALVEDVVVCVVIVGRRLVLGRPAAVALTVITTSLARADDVVVLKLDAKAKEARMLCRLFLCLLLGPGEEELQGP